jgi:hypothetical protein
MADVWQIGVKIGLTNGISPVLAIIAKDFLGLKGSIKEIEQAFGAWKPAIVGAAAALAGTEILKSMADLVDHGKELVHVQEQMAAAGMGQVDVANATASAWKAAADYGLKVSSILDDTKELRMSLGSTDHAIDFTDPLEKMTVVLNAARPGAGDEARGAAYDAMRAGELKGFLSNDQFTGFVNDLTKVITASGGKVDPKSFLQATQYGRLATKGWDEEFYTKYFPSLIQEMGGSQTGTVLSSLFGTIVQGKVTKRSLQAMEDLGLIDDPSKITYDRLGDPLGMKPGAIKGTDLFTKDPFKWSQEVLKPLLDAKLGHTAMPGDEGAIELLGGLMGSRTSGQVASIMTLEGQRINKDAGLIGQAKGLDAASDLLAHDPNTAMTNFKNSWDNLLTSLGSPLVQVSVDAMNSIASVMKSMTSFSNGHPEAIKLIGEGIIGLGGALAGLGVAAVVAACVSLGTGGAIAVGIGALGTLIAEIAAFHWQAVVDEFGSIKGAIANLTAINWHAIVDMFDGICKAITDFIAKIAALPGQISGAISGAAKGAWEGIWGGGGATPHDTGLLHKSSWTPPAGQGQPTVIHTALNVDGRRLATAVSRNMARNATWSGSSSGFDGQSMPAATDVSYI